MEKDIEWFELQLTVVRWHLDAANAARTDAVRAHIQKARGVHAGVCASLAHANFDKEARERLERECSELGTRLDAARGG